VCFCVFSHARAHTHARTIQVSLSVSLCLSLSLSLSLSLYVCVRAGAATRCGYERGGDDASTDALEDIDAYIGIGRERIRHALTVSIISIRVFFTKILH
jgi:hypothetical protein